MLAAEVANYAVNGLIDGLLISLPALALTLVMGVARFANAATGDYMTVPAYVAVGLQSAASAPLILATVGAVASGVLLSLFFYCFVFRPLRTRSFVTSMIASIGVAFLTRAVLTFFVGEDIRMVRIPLVRAWNFGGIRLLPIDLEIAATAIGAMLIVFAILQKTPIGRQIRAVANNPDLARASGIQTERVHLILWTLVGVLCAIGGVLYAIKAALIPELGWSLLISSFAAMVIGGVGNPLGAVAGAVLLGIVQELFVPVVGSSYKVAIAFIMMLLVLLIRPRGLLGTRTLVR